jgi:hypothetical protein
VNVLQQGMPTFTGRFRRGGGIPTPPKIPYAFQKRCHPAPVIAPLYTVSSHLSCHRHRKMRNSLCAALAQVFSRGCSEIL